MLPPCIKFAENQMQYRDIAKNGVLVRQKSQDEGRTWEDDFASDVPAGPVSGGTGRGEVQAVANNQTKVLLGVLTPFLVALLVAATSWLQSLGTAHETSLKEAIAAAVKEVMAGQQKQTEVIKQDVKPAAPVIVVPPIPPVIAPTTNPLDGMTPEQVKRFTDEWIAKQAKK